ncbi:MAG: 3-hydroxyacyl-CoA dehydrogenase [Pseudomonadota bacterium]
MKIDDVKRVLAIGAGTMGHQIGLLCALHGYAVVIYDTKQEALEFARKRIDALADVLVHKKRLPPELKAAVIGRIEFTDNAGEAAREVDVVTESVPEDPVLKGAIFRKFHALCPERTIFTTNTSMLIPSLFAHEVGRPEKFLAFHFHDIIKTDVVDIMPHPGTAPETTELVKAFAEKLGQVVVLLQKENYGYVFNALLSDLMKSSLALANKNVAAVEDIDRAWMGVMRTDIGPFGIMDSIGLDTVWKIVDYAAQMSRQKSLAKNAEMLKEYVDAGKLGVKTGEGFYRYPNPQYKQTGFLPNR